MASNGDPQPARRPGSPVGRVAGRNVCLRWALSTGLSVLSWLLSVSCALGADSPDVTITGGADTSGRNYAWTVRNEHASPIVYVEIPYKKVLMFFAPEGWQSDCGRGAGAVRERRAGTCVAVAASPASGIPYGAAAEFRMRLSGSGARRARGAVLIRFADGDEVQVDGVELPQRETIGDKYVSLFALGAIFATWVVVRAVRRRRSPDDRPHQPPSHHG